MRTAIDVVGAVTMALCLVSIPCLTGFIVYLVVWDTPERARAKVRREMDQHYRSD